MKGFTVFVITCVICIALFLILYGCSVGGPPDWFVPPTLDPR